MALFLLALTDISIKMSSEEHYQETIEVLTPSDKSCDAWLEKIFDLSRIVFAQEFEEARQEEALTGQTNAATDLSNWRNLLNHTGEVVYTMRNSLTQPEEVTAFAFTFERAAPFVDKTKKSQRPLHIWIAGCHPHHRRKGLMKQIFEVIEQRANVNGYTLLTVNTYPQKFESMPKFLESRQFEISSIVESHDSTKYCYQKCIT